MNQNGDLTINEFKISGRSYKGYFYSYHPMPNQSILTIRSIYRFWPTAISST